MCITCGCDHHSSLTHEEMHQKGIHHHHEEEIRLEMNILSENEKIAERNRGYFEAKNSIALNLVSSPGSGKTTLLETLIQYMAKTIPIAVIEGDQHTDNDAKRIAKTHVPVVQINTQNGCHLDARMVHNALHSLEIKENSILFIENVGNLVCPALFDLGETLRIVVISITEGEDKPLKYPYIFANAHLCIINKIDLLPHITFDMDLLRANIKQINKSIQIIETSAQKGEGIVQLSDFITSYVHTDRNK